LEVVIIWKFWSVLFEGSKCTWFSVSIMRYDVGRPAKVGQFQQALKPHLSYWEMDLTSVAFPYIL
jgi:hypothetical protein